MRRRLTAIRQNSKQDRKSATSKMYSVLSCSNLSHYNGSIWVAGAFLAQLYFVSYFLIVGKGLEKGKGKWQNPKALEKVSHFLFGKVLRKNRRWEIHFAFISYLLNPIKPIKFGLARIMIRFHFLQCLYKNRFYIQR